MKIRPRRSVLYMPGSNARALEKAKSIAADALILDLEDAVAPEAKETARNQVCEAVKAGGYGHRELVIRINALDTPWGQADLEAAAAAAPDAVLVPKPGSGADIVRATEALARAGAPDKTRLWAMIETPLAILNLARHRLRLAAAGCAARLLRPGHSTTSSRRRAPTSSINRRPALYWLSAALTAARAYGLDVLDGVYNNFKDAGRLPPRMRARPPPRLRRQDADPPRPGGGRQRGVRAAEAEVALARKIIAAFAQPESKGKGVITVEGRMVELLHAEMARAHRRHRRGHRADEGRHDARRRPTRATSSRISRSARCSRTPRRARITSGDVALYTGLYGPRFAVQSSDEFARSLGYPRAPVDDLLVFHTVFGKTVPDISLNAIANLGYAECRFLEPVYPGDTLSAASEVIGLRENSNRTSGVVYVRTRGRNQQGETVLEYVRWVMVQKARRRSGCARAGRAQARRARRSRRPSAGPCRRSTSRGYDFALAGAPHRWGDYAVGEKIDHADAMTLEEAEHQIATRLYQNTAKVHFNLHEQAQGQFKRRLVYGGVVISLARALSFNGLANAFHIAAINGGRHVAPCFAGDTVYAWSEVLETSEIPGRRDIGALRVRLTGVKNRSCAGFPLRNAKGDYDDGVILDLDLWVVLPR